MGEPQPLDRDLPTPAFDPANAGHWKLALLLEGVAVDAALAEEFEMATGVPVTKRLLLQLAKGVSCLARVRIRRTSAAGMPSVSLVATEEGWALEREGASLPVKVRPPIESALRGRVLRIHDYVVVDLSNERWGAAFRQHYGFPEEHDETAPRTVDPVLDAVSQVARSRTLRGVHVLAYRDPNVEDGTSPMVALANLFQGIHRNFATALSLECWPPNGVGALEIAYGSGVDMLYLNPASLAEATGVAASAERGRFLRSRFESVFESANEIFESGSVKSALLLERGNVPRITEEFDRLLRQRAVPLLWPSPRGERPSWEEGAAILAHAALALEPDSINLGRVEERVLQLPPSELRFFHPEGRPIRKGLQNAADTGLGRVAQRNLSALRRHLRVRGGVEDFSE